MGHLDWGACPQVRRVAWLELTDSAYQNTEYSLQHCPTRPQQRTDRCCPRCRQAAVSEFELPGNAYLDRNGIKSKPLTSVEASLIYYSEDQPAADQAWTCLYILRDANGDGGYPIYCSVG